MPGKIQLQENIPVATYKLTPTIRNKILNCKETAQAIIADDEISFSSSSGSCDCERYTFRDEHHGHSRDFRVITNTKRRGLSSSRPNYTELNTINYSKCKIVSDSSIDNSIEVEKLKTKDKLRGNHFNDWKDFVTQEVLKQHEISEITDTSTRHNNFLLPP